MNAIARELEVALQATNPEEARIEVQATENVPMPAFAQLDLPSFLRPRCALPCNEHLFKQLANAQAALIVLDELLAVVMRIELVDAEPTIYLQQPPRSGSVTGVCELVRIENGERAIIKRARFMGCTLEWSSL